MLDSLGLSRMESERQSVSVSQVASCVDATASLNAGASQNIDEDSAVAFAEGRAEGFREGLEHGRVEAEAKGRAEERARNEAARATEVQQRKCNAETTVQNFIRTQEQFQRQMENEAVRLSLAIAARILRREALMDPLLLTGAVRVALGQLSESAKVTLHVPQADLSLWRDAIEHLPNLSKRPVVVGEDAMELGEARIEAEMGSVDLSLKSQLVEIERGFFDRIGMETRANSSAARPEARQSTITDVEYLSEDEPVR
jgi:flagellar assembly protein FliH